MGVEKAIKVISYRKKWGYASGRIQVEDRGARLYRKWFVALLILCATSMSDTSARARWLVNETFYRRFNAELREICPEKKLNLLSPSDLLDDGDTYRQRLKPTLRRGVEKAIGWNSKNSTPRACQHIIAGASCAAYQNVEGFYRMGLLTSFVHRLCVSYKGCFSQSDCESGSRAKNTLRNMAGGEIKFPGHPALQIPPPWPPLPPSGH
jgi:hypothetical protein